ncbi:MAG: thioredoxin [Gammaproteobacteria bacterium]|nr:thioredoxin [Gammaproteobacteria bacterium]
MSEAYIFDAVGAENFDQQVIEKSFSTPVLVDFWAEWCAPCKALMPLLEKITIHYNGGLLLAKVNCDIEQEIVARFGVRSLPTVVLFKDGQPVDGFAGAQPESQIKEMLAKHLAEPEAPSLSPLEQAQQFFNQGEFAQAEALLKALLTEDNSNAQALILFGRCLIERNELAEAEQVLNAVNTDELKHALAAAKAQLTFLRQAEKMPEMADLKTRIAQDANDDEAVYQLAIQQLARQQYEPALQALLLIFTRNRSFNEGAAHRTLLQVFDLLGTEHPLVTDYRRKLYQALY